MALLFQASRTEKAIHRTEFDFGENPECTVVKFSFYDTLRFKKFACLACLVTQIFQVHVDDIFNKCQMTKSYTP